MGLLDQVIEKASGLFGHHEDEQASIVGAITQLLSDPQIGGIGGLVQSFDKAGLGDTVRSWVSNGQNLPISATQIESVLGNQAIQKFASQLGIDTGQASERLAEYLPQVIDKLTPNGNIPESADLVAQGTELLKSKVFGS
jgi:uncharacterized protein YidB (DUF937 family)